MYIFAIFLHEPLIRMMKKVCFDHFEAVLIVFNHVNACASMCFAGQNAHQLGLVLQYYDLSLQVISKLLFTSHGTIA